MIDTFDRDKKAFLTALVSEWIERGGYATQEAMELLIRLDPKFSGADPLEEPSKDLLLLLFELGHSPCETSEDQLTTIAARALLRELLDVNGRHTSPEFQERTRFMAQTLFRRYP